MKLGVLSDTHGDLKITRRAVEMLAARGAEALVHCGDVGSEACLEALADTGLPVHAVAGNVDDAVAMECLAAALNVHWGRTVLELPLGPAGPLAAVTHGDVVGLVEQLRKSGRYAFVLSGHTHRPRYEKVGVVVMVNPGALHRTAAPSVALLDVASGECEIIPVPRPA